MYGTFEFLRTGNSNALPARCVNQWHRHEKDKTGGYAGRNWDQLTQGGDQSGHTWNDFLLQIRAKMPGTRKTITVEDKMSRTSRHTTPRHATPSHLTHITPHDPT